MISSPTDKIKLVDLVHQDYIVDVFLYPARQYLLLRTVQKVLTRLLNILSKNEFGQEALQLGQITDRCHQRL
ncbi:MAG TPA: hypothetical protein VHV10_13250, partial [Ktedonobacteraceae bacterium]|nr:hypothetical protein [Ktedonobacteraceae bacterium]